MKIDYGILDIEIDFISYIFLFDFSIKKFFLKFFVFGLCIFSLGKELYI